MNWNARSKNADPGIQADPHPNSELQSEYRSLGPGGFAFEVLDRLEPKEGAGYDYNSDLKALEQM